MQEFACLILILCGLFFYLYQKQDTFIIPPRFVVIFQMYRNLRRLAFLIVICYSFVEFLQLIKWTGRMRRINQLENRLIKEIPEIDLLENLNRTFPLDKKE
jgi:hypothetical protein